MPVSKFMFMSLKLESWVVDCVVDGNQGLRRPGLLTQQLKNPGGPVLDRGHHGSPWSPWVAMVNRGHRGHFLQRQFAVAAAMLAPRTGRQALQRAVASSPSPSTLTLPSFLVPAFQAQQKTTTRRPFSATTNRPSKLGRTPLSIPPGVELEIGDLFIKKDVTSYLKTYKRKIAVTGPLGKQTLLVLCLV